MTVIPRWEWRTFGESFGSAEDHFAALSPTNIQESDELYVLSLRADDTVKVRDGLLDVKQLEHVNEDGLEQWRPVLKAAFPVPAAEVASTLATRATVPELARDEYTLDQLIDEVVEPSKELVAARVQKTRRHYTLNGCMAELTDVRTDRGATRTIAVEAEDPTLVSETVRQLGLSSRPNVSFPRGLKTLLGLGAHRYAVIDVGTNSVKFHIGERRADGTWLTLVDRAELTRLGEGLAETGELKIGAERTIKAIAAMADEAKRDGVEAIAAVGTAGLRQARNTAAFVEDVKARSGVEIEVISGEEEGRLAFLAATSGLELAPGPLVVFDSGGGSSQFTFADGDNVSERFSVDVGAARFTERYGLDGVVAEDVLSAALDSIAADLARLDGRPTPAAIVGMGGAVTNLAAVKHRLATYDPEVVQGTVLDLAEIDRQIELYRTRTVDERRQIVGLQPGRAAVILAGACIVRTVIAKLGRDSAIASDRGLRHGLLLERFGHR
jgi:exopolyphosphatase / guanosine-5'-triphosphate,3'-diphosphate pyrophosphatase